MDIEKSKVDQWLEEEKKCRLDNDAKNCARILTSIVEWLYNEKKFEELFSQLKQLAKKRGQSKKAIVEMVQCQMKHIPEIDDLPTKLQLIETLKDVCDKKIYLEVEYARCCLMMVKFNESNDNIEMAAKIMQDVQVETYGSMDKREKIDFILYQMKIMIKKQDYVRLYIISQKINLLNNYDEAIADLKVQYYAFLSLYYIDQNQYYQIGDCYKIIYDTLIKNNLNLGVLEFGFDAQKEKVFENFVMYTALSERSQEKAERLQEIKKDYGNQLDINNGLKQIIQNLLSEELGSSECDDFINLDIFKQEKSQMYKLALRKQFIQHNLVLFHKYYDTVQLQRVQSLLRVSSEEIENELCDLINNEQTKINRVTGIVNFKPKLNETQTLNNWSNDLKVLLNTVDQTCNQIKRDNQIYGV